MDHHHNMLWMVLRNIMGCVRITYILVYDIQLYGTYFHYFYPLNLMWQFLRALAEVV